MGKYVVMLVLLVATHASAQDVAGTNERRIGIESAVTLTAAGVAIGSGFAAAHTSLQNCTDDPYALASLGCGIRAGSILMAVTFTLLPVGLTFGSYLPHRNLGGQGRWYAALAGAAVGIGGGLGIVSIPANMKDDGAPMILGAVAGTLFAASMPILALELSHGRQRRIERRSARRMAPIANALPGGAWVGIAGTL